MALAEVIPSSHRSVTTAGKVATCKGPLVTVGVLVGCERTVGPGRGGAALEDDAMTVGRGGAVMGAPEQAAAARHSASIATDEAVRGRPRRILTDAW